MKVNKKDKYKTKLLRLKLLKTKIYKRNESFNYLTLKDIEARFKKALHIIYKFHVENKKILFIGTPIKLNKQLKQLLKDKKHSFIPESIWMKGIITNSRPSFKHLFKKHAINSEKSSAFLFNLKNQIDLIVVLNERLNLDALSESSLKRVTTISLNSSYIISNSYLSTYKIPGDFSFTKKEVRNNLFYLLLSSLLKKAEIFRKKRIKINVKQKESKLFKKKWVQTSYKKNAFFKKK